MPAYTPQTLAAIAAADWAYTRTWLKVVRVYEHTPDMREAMAAYNAAMASAHRQWNAARKDAVERDGDPF